MRRGGGDGTPRPEPCAEPLDFFADDPFGAGGFIWVLADEGIARTDQGGRVDVFSTFAPDGVVGPHHEKEGSFFTIRDIFSPVQIDPPTLDADFNGIRTRDNDYCQDRAAMKVGNFTGIAGIPNQDIAMWEGMGPISDRTQERVGASDVAVVAFRRLMVEAARAMAEGQPAIGTTQPHIPHATISSYEGVVPKTTNWRSLGGGSEAPRERVA